MEGGQRKWAGIWRSGSDGYYLWSASDAENFIGKWNELAKDGQRLLKFAPLEAACGDGCANHVVSRDEKNNPASYVYYVTGDPSGPYRWPVNDSQYARVSALRFDGQPFTLPFKDPAVKREGTWLYSPPPGNWHHAIDYSRGPDTFEVVAAAAGKVVFVGWDNWSGNTIIVSHSAGGVNDAFRTIYMHLRDGPKHDIDASRRLRRVTRQGRLPPDPRGSCRSNRSGAAQDAAELRRTRPKECRNLREPRQAGEDRLCALTARLDGYGACSLALRAMRVV